MLHLSAVGSLIHRLSDLDFSGDRADVVGLVVALGAGLGAADTGLAVE